MADLYASRAPVRLNDGTADANNATVMNSAPAGTEYALVVRALMPTSTVVDTELPAAAALTSDAVASPTAPAAAGFLYGYNGATWDRVKTANTGRLQVDIVSGGGGAAPADNSAFTDGTTPVTPVGYIYDEVAGTGLTENDTAAARIDVKRAQVSVIEDATTRTQRPAVNAAGALKADLSSVAGTATVTGGVAGVQAIGGPTAADAAIAAQPVTVGARASTATPTAMTTDGDVVNLWASLNGALNVTLRDASGTYVGAGGGSQYVGDAAITATPTGTVDMGLAHAAAPSDVSADNDAVAQWYLRNGSS